MRSDTSAPSSPSSSPASQRQAQSRASASSRPITIAVIGDVHDQWEAADDDALHQLNVDLALFVGDFGNESVDVVQAIANLDIPKAVILGNHDAWYNATGWGRAKCPYDRRKENRVQTQLDLLGETHVGYRYLDFPQFELSVVGGRPFSWGGPDWKHRRFYRDWFGVENLEQSTDRIRQAVDGATYSTVIMIGHCGPTGLGDRPEHPCGRDWNPLGGDYGDPDLERAIAHAQATGKRVPLVTFGHMHHSLRHRKDRLRDKLAVGTQQTVYLNAAAVPRIIEDQSQRLRNFSLLTLDQGQVTRAALTWVDASVRIYAEEVLYENPQAIAQLTPS